jgi:hypothetical protein
MSPSTRPFELDLSDDLYYRGERTYSARHLALVPDLFRHRVALFMTPTKNIPQAWVGRGGLRVRLPIPTTSVQEAIGLRAYRTPRLWVDLLQRATAKLRWQPMWPAHVTIVRYDDHILPTIDFIGGLKALQDALKVRTAGRRDGRILHYFGAIRDDDMSSIVSDWQQRLVKHPRQAHVDVLVRPTAQAMLRSR